jgi:hypothetical protein
MLREDRRNREGPSSAPAITIGSFGFARKAIHAPFKS